ncbi:hypothetical protein IT418_02590 [bacterium]|nr:hypothetical protein [bacterium]
MKRLLGILLDTLFFISFNAVAAVTALVIIYAKEQDISIINMYLQTALIPTMLIGYGAFMLNYLVYFWIIPSFLKQTVGQRLAGTSFQSEHKIGLWRVFLKTIVGRFWDLLLFPYTIFAAVTKRAIISTSLSGVVVSKIEKKPTKSLYTLTTLFSLFLVGTLAVSTYVYRTGVTPIMERYTNYEKLVNELIEKLAYQDAAGVLEKYKQYHGDNENYSFYKCVIDSNLSTEPTVQELCNTALEKNAGNKDRVKKILSEQAKVYAANDQYKDAEALYAKLWTEYSDRSLDMKNYVVVLSELGKNQEATEILKELAKQIDQNDELAVRDLGNLYERIGNTDLALEQYQKALTLVESSNQSLAGELNYNIGVIQYNKAKYSEAQANFEKAKELNKDFAEPADSYIILISKLKNSVVK